MPACGGQGRGAVEAANGLEIEIAITDFDTSGAGFGVAGDELAFAADFDGTEVVTGGGIESPDLLTGASEFVLVGELAAIFIEPEAAGDGEAGWFHEAHAAEFFIDLERLGGGPLVDGEGAPVGREGGLGDIDGGDSGELDEAEAGLNLKADEFLFGDGFDIGGEADCLGGGGAVGGEGDGPFAGADLGFEEAGVVHGDGNGGVDGGEAPAIGEGMAEGLLATFASDTEFDAGLEPLRGAVLEETEELGSEEIFVGGFGAGALEPEATGVVPDGEVDRLAVELQRKDADEGG